MNHQMIAAAEQLGFVNRGPEPDIKTQQTLGPVVMTTMWVLVRIARQLKLFRKTNRYSDWKGIEALMKRAEVS